MQALRATRIPDCSPWAGLLHGSPTLLHAARTAQARIELANPGQALKIGMFVNVAFAALGGAESTAPMIPKGAVQNVSNLQVVFVETATPHTYAMWPVKLGPETNVSIRCLKA